MISMCDSNNTKIFPFDRYFHWKSFEEKKNEACSEYIQIRNTSTLCLCNYMVLLCIHAYTKHYTVKIDNACVIFKERYTDYLFAFIKNAFRLNSFPLKLSKFKIVNTEYLRKQAFNLRWNKCNKRI